MHCSEKTCSPHNNTRVGQRILETGAARVSTSDGRAGVEAGGGRGRAEETCPALEQAPRPPLGAPRCRGGVCAGAGSAPTPGIVPQTGRSAAMGKPTLGTVPLGHDSSLKTAYLEGTDTNFGNFLFRCVARGERKHKVSLPARHASVASSQPATMRHW